MPADKKSELSTNNLILVVALVSLVVIIITLLLARGLFEQLGLNNRVLAKKTAASRQVKANLDAIPDLISNYEALGSRIQLIENSLPQKPDFPGLLSTLEVMAGTSGVRLSAVTEASNPTQAFSATGANTTATPAKGPQSLNFSLETGGSYTNLLSFFRTFEISSRPMRLISLQFKGTSSAIRSTVDMQTHYQGPVDLTPKTEVVK